MRKLRIILLISVMIYAIVFTFSKIYAQEDSINESISKSEELQKIDDLYKKYKTIKAKFVQTDSNGNTAQGWFIIQKPGKARIDYETLPIRLIANGKSLMVQDLNLKQKSFLPMSSIPFAYLLDEHASLLNENIEVKDFKSFEDYNEIQLISKSTPDLGSITLFLTKDKAEIIKWVVYDAQGITTDIYLLEAEFLDVNVKNQSIFNIQNTKDIKYDNIQ